MITTKYRFHTIQIDLDATAAGTPLVVVEVKATPEAKAWARGYWSFADDCVLADGENDEWPEDDALVAGLDAAVRGVVSRLL